MSTPKSHQVRHDLLEAARALIAERGWTAVSTRTLAHRAGVGPGLVHYHFPSLRALLNEAALTGMAQVIDQTLTDLPRTDPRQGLDHLLGKLHSYPPDDPATVLFTEAYLAATRDADLRRGITDLLQRLRTHLTAWLDDGHIADPENTAHVLAATADGLMLHRSLDPHLNADQVAPVLRRLLNPPPQEEQP
ncbi:TetR/AcrR family transcriptional regulator [Nocardiopsis sp. HNM0947]|uniref:TetR/AcrR family transcriptional regulator n=1 Tax=Nocardiopsis coralli TaxID=2772213 RepID=A0ABR9P795_9ACTN|nr:TetR/AcrR family transcriptional regulator [Nocardiopsis coralli]MBE2999570.1 TetR/AcrR family transcriptional regulator [Nocardiopsis coralli]